MAFHFLERFPFALQPLIFSHDYVVIGKHSLVQDHSHLQPFLRIESTALRCWFQACGITAEDRTLFYSFVRSRAWESVE